jgi:hypothetical protein
MDTDKEIATQVGLTAIMCLVMAAVYGEWQFTYGSAFLGAWLVCARNGTLPSLWPCSVGALAMTVSRSQLVAHLFAGLAAFIVLAQPALPIYQKIKYRHT